MVHLYYLLLILPNDSDDDGDDDNRYNWMKDWIIQSELTFIALFIMELLSWSSSSLSLFIITLIPITIHHSSHLSIFIMIIIIFIPDNIQHHYNLTYKFDIYYLCIIFRNHFFYNFRCSLRSHDRRKVKLVQVS